MVEQQILELLAGMKSDIEYMKKQMADIDEIKEKVKDIDVIKEKVKDIDVMKEDIAAIKIQLDENTQILRTLEHPAQVNKAEHDKIFHEIAEMRGEIRAIRKDLTTVEIVTSNNWNELARLKAVR
jgi:Fe2+ transport system protein B